MNLIALTDTRLAALHRQVTNEIERRTRIATNGYDPAAIIQHWSWLLPGSIRCCWSARRTVARR